MHIDEHLEEDVAHVKSLLELLPGVNVVWLKQYPTLIRFGLDVRSATSLARLAHISRGANVPLGVEVDWHWNGSEDDPDCLRYDLRVMRDHEPYEPPNTLQKVGVFLVWHFKKLGTLDSAEACKLLDKWNAGD